jgi:ankyrin repeat protein
MDPDPAVATWPLWKAVIDGSVPDVQRLLTAKVNINSQLPKGMTLLQAAACNNRGEVIRILIKIGANVDLPDETRWTPLHKAVSKGAKQAVSALIANGAHVNRIVEEKYTALHRAASLGDSEIAQMLIDAGASVDAQANLKTTPLHIAVQKANLAVVKVLIHAGADLNILDHIGWNPFHMAAAEGYKEVVETLLAKCSELLESKTKSGLTALYLAAQSGRCSVMSSLLHAEAQIDTKSSTGTALHVAATNGHVEVVRLLLEKNADSKLRLDDGRTALHLAAAYNHESVAEVLVSHNKHLLRATDNVDSTPLHMAVIYCHQTMVEFLLQMDADPNTRDVYCRSPAEHASNNETLRKIFVNHCSNIQATPSKLDEIKHLKGSIRQMDLLLERQGQRSNHQIYDVLGHLYVLLGEDKKAMDMFSEVKVHQRENNEISCSFCPKANAIERTRFVCRTCPYVDLCGGCYKTYEGCPLAPGRRHELTRVPNPTFLSKL